MRTLRPQTMNRPAVATVLINGALFNISWLAIVYTHSPGLALSITGLHLARTGDYANACFE